MDIKFMNQPKDVQMGKILNTRLEENFKEAWIVSGISKDSGIELLLASVENAIKRDMKVNVMLGADRKNTSKDALTKLLSVGANLSIHVNGDSNKVETRIYAFESENDNSYIYISGGKLSEGGLTENNCIITEIKYEAKEYENFKLFKQQLLLGTENIFKTVDKNDIELLAMKGEIVARITERKIPSISELYGEKENIVGEQIYDEGKSLGLFDKDELENIDIEIDDKIDIKKNVEMEAEKEAKENIFEKTNKTQEDLDRLLGIEKEETTSQKSRIVKDLNQNDFKNMTTLIIEAGKPLAKDKEVKEIRIPRSLAMLMPEYLNVETEKQINLDIVDNKTNREYSEEGKIYDNGKGVSISSPKLSEVNIEENDVIRIIKIDNEKYKIEIIRNNTDEYNVWERYCTNTIKGTKRRFGII